MAALTELPISKLTARLARKDLRRMMALVRLVYRLSKTDKYRQLVRPQLPEICSFDPGHDALMMGYDFHLTADGPKLIEINTNAGGGYIAWLSEAQSSGQDPIKLTGRIQHRLLDTFKQEWRSFSGSDRGPQRVVLVDEEPEEQPLYPEMVACRDWLRREGISSEIAAPGQLQTDSDGVFLNGEKIDLVYNRHCDFFLDDDVMAGLRQAYLAKTVCLSPNPFAYGLLADKRRMILWSDPATLTEFDLSKAEQQLLLQVVPQSRLLADCDDDQVWAERKQLIFKPVTRFGSRGVVLGKGITRKRFAEQDPATTLVQSLVAPSVETSSEGEKFKVDLRLFVYRDRLLGVGARLYQGQVTNLRTVGGGFAPVRLY
ncbi:hypothetical protein SAMN02745165_01190 [Malonomonas rubra DSM 5091]|uniref:Uncharacterized protein n=1 Tax=Malonomonas rubra DSM 5091 TaxID=1122189 RepID=A0A1M6F8S5_MALRU|nr:hypothetical protein [Malonomonas rubra]SHI93999.1 hypothetical protein SAMN02745165_01190 [Malonomonas rubra DSM 5091]